MWRLVHWDGWRESFLFSQSPPLMTRLSEALTDFQVSFTLHWDSELAHVFTDADDDLYPLFETTEAIQKQKFL